MLLHPHVHCMIPAGGLSADHKGWVHPRDPFFLPVKALSRVFRGKFVAGLKHLYRRRKLDCSGPAASLAEPKQFGKLLRSVHRQDWVVYAKPAFGGPSQVLRYLGRYSPGRYFQSQDRGLRWRARHVSLQGLCARRQTPGDDPDCRRVPSALLLTRPAEGIRSHPPLRLSRQPLANSSPCDLS